MGLCRRLLPRHELRELAPGSASLPVPTAPLLARLLVPEHLRHGRLRHRPRSHPRGRLAVCQRLLRILHQCAVSTVQPGGVVSVGGTERGSPGPIIGLAHFLLSRQRSLRTSSAANPDVASWDVREGVLAVVVVAECRAEKVGSRGEPGATPVHAITTGAEISTV
jgi:hypothetical protein